LSGSVPPFLAGANDVLHSVTSQRTATTLVLDRGGNIWTRFQPGDRVTMTAAEFFVVSEVKSWGRSLTSRHT